jgi:Flp pilus assembly protein TadB
MSSFAGLLFLLGGIALFIAAVLFLVAWERSGRTRRSLHKIHHAQTTLREAARSRARAMHPSGRRAHLHRARHRRGA